MAQIIIEVSDKVAAFIKEKLQDNFDIVVSDPLEAIRALFQQELDSDCADCYMEYVIDSQASPEELFGEKDTTSIWTPKVEDDGGADDERTL